MKFPVPRPVFADVQITKQDEEAIVALVDMFVDKVLAEEHDYLVTRGGRVNPNKWKRLRQCENIVVYRERSRSVSMDASLEQGSLDKMGRKLIPPFMMTGTVEGKLDDLLYGSTTPTREATLIKTTYVDDSIADVELLHQLRSPTKHDPFSHLSIKWTALAPHASVVNPRDYVYIDTIGTRVLPDGERIGYRLTHSIDVKGAGPLTSQGFLRANLSLCGIFRQGSSNDVHIYGRGFFEPGGDIPRSIFTLVVSKQIASLAAQVVNAQMKKLALALHHAQAEQWTIAKPPPARASVLNSCGICLKPLTLVNKSRSRCALCTRRLCHACRVHKQLSFVEEHFRVARVKATFCTCCLAQAISLPSFFAATEEFLGDHEAFYRIPSALRVDSTQQ